MTTLGIAVAWLMLQVTVVAAIAFLLDTVLARRDPVATPRLMGIAVILVVPLTVAALSPAPAWWSWRAPQPSPVAETAPPLAETNSSSHEGTSLVSLTQFTRFFAIGERPATTPVNGWAVLSGVYLTGATLFLGSLALGMVQLALIRRRSRPVLDPTILDLANTIASQIGVYRRVALREADLSGLPATVGWLRPVILLPPDWRAMP